MEKKKEEKSGLRGEAGKKAKKDKEKEWKKPVLEDVSGRVMAQPYIRFT